MQTAIRFVMHFMGILFEVFVYIFVQLIATAGL